MRVTTNVEARRDRPSLSAARSRGYARALDHLVLLKPRVMSLVVFTGAIGYLLAPGKLDLLNMVAALAAMAAAAGACGALNMWWDADIDAQMSRTAARPIPRGRVEPREALILGLALGIVSLTFMALRVNFLAAALLALTIAIYIPFYTMGIKRRTPQNIVWGGAAGALPPVIGWAAAANSVNFGALAMFLVIFLWTPPHFWSLALRRSADYERVGVPMLPNVVGSAETCRQIAIYAAMLVAASFTPLVIPRVGLVYGLVAAALDAALMWRVLKLYSLRNGPEAEQRKVALGLFGFSILYLFALFVALGVTAIAF